MVTRGSSTPAVAFPRSQPASGASTTPRRSTPVGHAVGRAITSASPTRETLPAATMRGSRCRRPSGVRPLAGLRTPSASSGSPGSGDITTPSRVSVNGRGDHPFTPEPRLLWTKWRWKTTNSATAGAASTHAPARIAPNGLEARPDTVEM